MPATVDLARLPKMSLEELRALWATHFKGPPPSPRTILIREIAWLWQERRNGGFDVRTNRLLQAAMRAATADLQHDASTNLGAPGSPRRQQRKPNVSPVLPAAVRLVREWGGVRHEITVVENGRAYRYRDKTYKSLTQVATVITGTHRSGPGFFGLVRRENKKSSIPTTSKGRPHE